MNFFEHFTQRAGICYWSLYKKKSIRKIIVTVTENFVLYCASLIQVFPNILVKKNFTLFRNRFPKNRSSIFRKLLKSETSVNVVCWVESVQIIGHAGNKLIVYKSFLNTSLWPESSFSAIKLILMSVCPYIVSIIRNLWTKRCKFLVYLFVPNQLYMFRTTFSPIIRSTWLYLQFLI